jgi:hypothetical protein
VITAAISGTAVLASEFTEVGAIAVTTGTPEVAGDTITFGGATYTAGIDFTDGAGLVTILSDRRLYGIIGNWRYGNCGDSRNNR